MVGVSDLTTRSLVEVLGLTIRFLVEVALAGLMIRFLVEVSDMTLSLTLSSIVAPFGAEEMVSIAGIEAGDLDSDLVIISTALQFSVINISIGEKS